MVGSIQISFTTVKDGRGEGLLLGPPTVVEPGVARTWHLGRRSVPLLLVLFGCKEEGSEEEESLESAEAWVRERRVAWESLGDCLIWGTTKGGATKESEEREPSFLKTGDGQGEVEVVEADVADPLVSDRLRVIVEDEDEDVVVERWSSSRGVEGGGVGLEDVKGVKKSMRELRRLVPDPELVLLSREALSTVGVREWLGVVVKEFEMGPAPPAPVTDADDEEAEEVEEEERKRSRRDWMRRLEDEAEGWRGKDSMLETRTTWCGCGRVCVWEFVWW